MSKSKEELNEIKEEVETVSKKLAELTPEEIAQVDGGGVPHDRPVIEPIVIEPTVLTTTFHYE